MTNSADPDQLASGSILFAKTGHVMFSKRRVKCKRIKGVFTGRKGFVCITEVRCSVFIFPA